MLVLTLFCFFNSVFLVTLTSEDPNLEQRLESETMTCTATAATLNLNVSMYSLSCNNHYSFIILSTFMPQFMEQIVLLSIFKIIQ